MAEKKATGKKPVGPRRGGNVVLDLGEEIDKVVAQAKAASPAKQGLGAARPGWRPGFLGSGFRPGLGFRPTHPSRLGQAIGLQRSVDTMDVLGGSLAGTAFNRVVYRLVPKLFPAVNSELLVNGVGALAGILPYFVFKKDGHGRDFTVGFAIPGVVMFAGSLFDKLLGAVAKDFLPKPVLSGADAGRPVVDAQRALQAAHNTLASMRGSLGSRPAIQPAQVPTRVAARAS